MVAVSPALSITVRGPGDVRNEKADVGAAAVTSPSALVALVDGVAVFPIKNENADAAGAVVDSSGGCEVAGVVPALPFNSKPPNIFVSSMQESFAAF